ncbi:hypothetical protein DFQ14_101364 [Halopolyspora algeriensis]|uniref:Uncharacterized protein n=1 Tax=Halopolyspora algeriensis TaxID=1500506 RepID=A0A368VYJ5_9ACTN|nr:hypothetical protein [Halopolyspora algeriensis]RCW47021.1 hypothetical protein DFQ14_101364 [Halopolyspora algeriensis]TQM48108.1 hypothetical protein FHU43_3069 [Halopolyspora algeriensis]
MTRNDTWFLLVQYRHKGTTQVYEYDDPGLAADAYSETEKKFRRDLGGSDPEVDVLLVGAESLNVVKERYPSYFIKAKSRSDKLNRLLAALPVAPVG